VKRTFIIYGLLLTLRCAAVNPYERVIADPVLEPWRWREMEELADLDILSIDEAADGAIWFGCIGGLARYDGRQIERIPFDDGLLSGIAHDPNRTPWGKSVLCMRDGGLLAVVENGLVLRTGGAWKVIERDVGHSIFDSRLEQSGDGTVWLLMPDALWRFSEDLTKRQVVFRAKGSQALASFCHDLNGDVWVLRTKSSERPVLIHIPLRDGRVREEQDWRTFRLDMKNISSEPRICADLSGKIWCVDSRLDGVFLFDPSTGSGEMTNPSDFGYNFVMRDRGGGIWAAGAGTLKALHRTGDPVYSATQLGLPNIFLSLFETANGMAWVLERGGKILGSPS